MNQSRFSSLSLEGTTYEVKTVGYVDPQKFMQPHSVWATDSHLYITDFGNNRLLIYDTLKPELHDQPRQIIHVGGSDIGTFKRPSNVVVCNDSLYLTDFGNKRLLIYDTPVPQDGDSPIIIKTIKNGTPKTFNAANGLFVTSQAVYMTDSFQNRLIVWDTPKPRDGQSAHIFQRLGGVQPETLNNFRSVYIHNHRCYLDDFDNNRLLIFDSPLPKDGDVPAVVDKLSGVEPNTFNCPCDICGTDKHLLVTDFYNSRVLIFDTFDLTNGIAPVAVIDQSGSENIQPRCLYRPRDLFISDRYIYLAGFQTYRLLIFDRKEMLPQ